MNKPIIVSYPCGDMVHADFTHCLSMLALYSVVKHRLWIGISQTRGSIICASRNMQVRQARDAHTGFSHILFLDSDMIFPHDTLTRLLTYDKPVVGASYCMRREPRAMTHRNRDFSSTLSPPGESFGDIYQVLSLGMGCVLIKAEVFDAIRKIDPVGPFFQVEYQGEEHHTGEDVGFFKKVNAAGIPVYCDIELSHAVRHVGTYAYGPADVQRVYDGSEPSFEMTALDLPRYLSEE